VSDNTYGVYVSIRLPSGELFSVSRETVADLKQDLDVFLGDGASSRIQSKLASAVNTEPQAPRATVSAGSGPVGSAGTPGLAGAAQPSNPSDVEALANINAVLGVEPEAGQSFEACEKCGGLKDKWVPGGTSQKTGKTYAGFWSCPNFRNHR